MRFSPFEGPCIRAYFVSFDDSSATNRLGAIENEPTNYELFLPKPTFWKCSELFLDRCGQETVFTGLMQL